LVPDLTQVTYYRPAVPFCETTEPGVAAAALGAGHLVVLPTETVYGLGARADDAHAVARVFATKGRPADHPLIAHVYDIEAARMWARQIPDYAEKLMAEFWPGPMTLVLPRSTRAADFITGGQDTVGVRVPGSPVAREVLRALAELTADPGIAIAAPSANRFGRVSPTTAQHAQQELGELLDDSDVILDAGPCVVGVESTIIDCSGGAPVLLRPGKITAEQIEAVGEIPLGSGSVTRAPGTLASHYAPRARVQVTDPESLTELRPDPTVGIIALASVPTPPGIVRLCAPHNDDEYAACLYRALREADSLNLTSVVAVPPEGAGLAEAIRDRLQRAAHR
jgi:L-threonylcarbamoyladenylate synthase